MLSRLKKLFGEEEKPLATPEKSSIEDLVTSWERDEPLEPVTHYDVRWSVFNRYGGEVPNVQTFISSEKADAFKESLNKAAKFLRVKFYSEPGITARKEPENF